MLTFSYVVHLGFGRGHNLFDHGAFLRPNHLIGSPRRKTLSQPHSSKTNLSCATVRPHGAYLSRRLGLLIVLAPGDVVVGIPSLIMGHSTLISIAATVLVSEATERGPEMAQYYSERITVIRQRHKPLDVVALKPTSLLKGVPRAQPPGTRWHAKGRTAFSNNTELIENANVYLRLIINFPHDAT